MKNMTKTRKWTRFSRKIPLHLMMIPAVVILLLYAYGPMIGIVLAFEKFNPTKGFFGSKWVGFDNFKYLIALPNTFQVLKNTFYIAFLKIIAGIAVPLLFSLLLNEVSGKKFKKGVQTIIYIPHFLSWIILSGIIIDILSPSEGIVNEFIKLLGFEPIFFLGNPKAFPNVLIITNTWKEFGFGTIIYLASLTSIDTKLYEAARIDGANRWKQTWHITIPGMLPIIMLMTILSLGNVLNAGFDQVFNLYSPIVYETGDILDTFVYRIGMLEGQYSVATAAGLFKSIISFVFIGTSYFVAYKYMDYQIF